MQSFYWHDYETFGADPIHDRPSQFAGIRTDADLNVIGDPLILYCLPGEDYLPAPDACLITGITPQKAKAEGVSEADFIGRILQQFSQPGTCVVGYNSLRFDDEVTRHTLFRNLRDPYAREWQNGNSRWDIIDMVRLTYALRPDGIIWPSNEDGSPSFRLERLTEANGIAHEAAHDAMSDVYATIAVARLIREKQPRLFDYVLSHKDKASAFAMLDVQRMQPVFHVSSRFPARLGCGALVAPVARHPDNPNAVIVYDLREDPAPLIDASVEEIRGRLFVPQDQLPPGEKRIPLKAVHANRCPILAPAAMLKTLSAERLAAMELDGDQLRQHLAQLRATRGLAEKVAAVFQADHREGETPPDVDESLYSGGFIGKSDREKLNRLLQAEPALMAGEISGFDDPRLEELVFRYRARNFPATLDGEEQERWEQFRQQRLMQPPAGWRSLPEYLEQIGRRLQQPDLPARDRHILEELHYWGEALIPYN